MSKGSRDLDVVVIGAGLSGIAAGYYLQKRCPGKTYAILEARRTLGGTWDLFRYPGIRSDSDMHTLGFSFRPWAGERPIADGPSILSYLKDTAREYGIDQEIRYGHKVERARWSSDASRWTLDVRESATGEMTRFSCRFVLVCAGYYDYEAGYTPEFAGRDRFKGTIVHPQKWPEGLDYSGKRVVVIGSGATAVTLVPALADRAAHVTMLQRSPTYVLAPPSRDKVAEWMRSKLPRGWAAPLTRWKNVGLGMAFYAFSRGAPDRAKAFMVGQVRKHLKGSADVAKHFTPTYAPWDQRVCLAPGGDIFTSIREGKVSVVTDHIDSFTERGIRLKSGEELAADVIVTATGLRLKFLGGIALEVDGKHVEPSQTMTYKGMMCSDIPNMALAIGYTNASWTLKCELTIEYACRLLNYMDAHGYSRCVPRRNDPTVKELPLIDFSSGYVRRSIDKLPRQGSAAPWRLYQNYALDRVLLRHAPLADSAMEFSSPER